MEYFFNISSFPSCGLTSHYQVKNKPSSPASVHSCQHRLSHFFPDLPPDPSPLRYTASALVDQALHQLPMEALQTLDLNKFEEKELQRLGMPQV